MFKPALTGGSFEITFWIKFTTSTADQRAVSADNGTNIKALYGADDGINSVYEYQVRNLEHV